jgi:anti-sigma B factor antagonist
MGTAQGRAPVERAVGPDLTLVTWTDGAKTVLEVRGELDAYSAPGLEAEVSALLEQDATDVVLDLSPTRFCDSSGLRAILATERALSAASGRLTLRSPSEPVTRLLEVSGLMPHFAVETQS